MNALEKIKHTLFRSWYTLETLEDRIYHIILDVAVFMSVPTVIFGIIQHMPGPSVVMSVAILVFLIIIQFVTMRCPKYADLCRMLLVLGMNLVFLPVCFFTAGGLYSGMILFFATGFVLCGLLLRGKTAGIVFTLTLVVMELALILSVRFPEFVEPMTPEQHLLDAETALILVGTSLFAVTGLLLRSYAEERDRNVELMQKLRDLSVMDALSGLYNRRELFRRLEVMYGDIPKERTETLSVDGRYLAMFDIDNFKTLNDTYGHGFGDTVLVSVANVLRDMVKRENGELSARYGGEEFVSILRAPSREEAYARVNQAREEIMSLSWEEFPAVRVSISGGLIACEDHADLTQALHDVDDLLYKAKAAGKNQVCI
ncbi:MAG: GGDEF domain-containing protein [Oscillospiraceae bacterium]|nr:GGDEF domain-containing protein [Oscillospiraceae bacterium]